jgi:hypothetical protein
MPFSPWRYVTFFTFGFFRFYLSAMPSLPPATLSELRPVCFSSDPPPCYINDAEGKIVCQTKMKFFLNFIVEVIMDST